MLNIYLHNFYLYVGLLLWSMIPTDVTPAESNEADDEDGEDMTDSNKNALIGMYSCVCILIFAFFAAYACICAYIYIYVCDLLHFVLYFSNFCLISLLTLII